METAQNDRPALAESRGSPAPPDQTPPQKPAGPPWYTRRWVWILGSVVLLIGLALTAWGIWYARKYESTDDAYTDGHVVEISAQIAGRISTVSVNDNDDVAAGQVLLEIDPRDFQSDVNQSEAQLKVAQAEEYRANAELQQDQKASASGAVSTQDLQEIIAAERKATASVAQAQAALSTAQLKLSYTKITAPFAGRIARKNIEPGAYVTPGQSMMALVDPHVWVEANFKETQLTLMKPGDVVRVKVDAFPQRVWQGHIDSVQPGSGARFSVLPAENATGNFVKIVQRVPVKIILDNYLPNDSGIFLGVGLSVKPRVTVR